MPDPRSFQEVLSAAIDDLVENGFDSMERVARWTRELRAAAERSLISPASLEQTLREGLAGIYKRMVDQEGLLRYNPGVERFRLEQIKPKLRGELDRRIAASADLIKLNRQEAIEKTLRRFQGWSTSIPAGGTKQVDRREQKKAVRKSMASLPFEERRVLIDQGHKLTAAISEIVASDGGAIAGRWRSNWRQPGYDYRDAHKERDEKVYLIRDSWAHRAGLVKKGKPGYYDEITAAGEEPFCRCYVVWLYALRELPEEMLTAKGRTALADVRTVAAARTDSAEPRVEKQDAMYVGPGVDRPPGERCEVCSMWRPPEACSAVDGLIQPEGYCRLFEAAVRDDAGGASNAYNAGIMHLGRRGPGSEAACGNRRAHATYGKEQFRAAGSDAQCKRCAAKLEIWDRISARATRTDSASPPVRPAVGYEALRRRLERLKQGAA